MTSTARHTEPPSAGQRLEDISELVGFVAEAGPPVFVAGGAAVFGALLLAGPFALAVTLVIAMALAAACVALLAGAVVVIVAAPYMLLRRARRFRLSHPVLHVGHRGHTARAIPAAHMELR
jgi:hypothetical protein